MQKQRITSIDMFRVLAIFAVICIHTGFNANLTYFTAEWEFIQYIPNHIFRFAVPFFFMASGYFFGKKLQTTPASKVIRVYCRRFFLLFIAWSVFYSVVPTYFPLTAILHEGINFNYVDWLQKTPVSIMHLIYTSPIDVLFTGASFHLWFFPSLLFAYIVLSIFILTKQAKYALAFAVLLYVFGLIFGKYLGVVTTIHFPFWFNTRNGPYFSMLFVVIGWRIAQLKKIPSCRQAIVLLVSGLLCQEAEAYVLWQFFSKDLLFDYLLGTVPFAMGIFILLLQNPYLGKNSVLQTIAPLVLGIYGIHVIVMSYINGLSVYFTSGTWQFAYPMFIFIISIVVVRIFKRFRFTRMLVM